VVFDLFGIKQLDFLENLITKSFLTQNTAERSFFSDILLARRFVNFLKIVFICELKPSKMLSDNQDEFGTKIRLIRKKFNIKWNLFFDWKILSDK
jgi:hypothetical protein